MGFGALRNIIRPVSFSSSRTVTSRISTTPSTLPFCSTLVASRKPDLLCKPAQWFPIWNQYFHSLTDTRFPKRRPSDKPRRKRASLKPTGMCVTQLFSFFVVSFWNWILRLKVFRALCLGSVYAGGNHTSE